MDAGLAHLGRVVDYDLTELRSHIPRQDRPVLVVSEVRPASAGADADSGADAASDEHASAEDGAVVGGVQVVGGGGLAAALVDEVAMEADGGGGDDEAVRLDEVRRVVTQMVVAARGGDEVTHGVRRTVVGLTRSRAWRRRERERERAIARARARRDMGGTHYIGRRLIAYTRSWAAAAERAWLWAWGVVQREWTAWAGGRRRRPEVGGQDRVHGRPPDG